MTALPRRADVVVIGGGVMGASIAYHLTLRAGVSVVLVERATVCSGPTRHSTAIVRMHYSQALLVRMALHGLHAYSSFEETVGTPSGFVRTGLLVGAGEHDAENLARNAQLGQGLGVTTELLEPGDLATLDPRISPDGLGAICFEPAAGYCDPYLVTAGFAAAARCHGAVVAEGVEALAVEPGSVQTTAGHIAAASVVVAAGAWSRELLVPLGYELPVRAAPAEVGRFRLPAGLDPPLPSIADFSELQFYVRPAEPGSLEVGSLDPRHAEEPVDPNRPPEGASEATLASFEEALARRVPGSAGGHWRGAWTGVYDVTPDWHPVIGWIPGMEGVAVAAGFSGHGFKLAPAVGLAVAELVVDGAATTFELDLLSPDRFARGALVGTAYGYSVLG